MRCIDALELKCSIAASSVIEDGKHIFDIIDEQPTIEPDWTELLVICDNCGHAIHIKRTDAKTKTGQWIDRQLIYSDLHVATCSNCKMRIAVGKFCPNCGIKMEEGDRE